MKTGKLQTPEIVCINLGPLLIHQTKKLENSFWPETDLDF